MCFSIEAQSKMQAKCEEGVGRRGQTDLKQKRRESEVGQPSRTVLLRGKASGGGTWRQSIHFLGGTDWATHLPCQHQYHHIVATPVVGGLGLTRSVSGGVTTRFSRVLASRKKENEGGARSTQPVVSRVSTGSLACSLLASAAFNQHDHTRNTKMHQNQSVGRRVPTDVQYIDRRQFCAAVEYR